MEKNKSMEGMKLFIYNWFTSMEEVKIGSKFTSKGVRNHGWKLDLLPWKNVHLLRKLVEVSMQPSRSSHHRRYHQILSMEAIVNFHRSDCYNGSRWTLLFVDIIGSLENLCK